MTRAQTAVIILGTLAAFGTLLLVVSIAVALVLA
jgi:hypothetical protein